MRWKIKGSRQEDNSWHTWFAWHPVRVGHTEYHTEGTKIIWKTTWIDNWVCWEWVERKGNIFQEYRLLGDRNHVE